MTQHLNRIPPAMAPGSYQTYGYSRGRDIVVKGTCQSVGCRDYALGWDTLIDERTSCGHDGRMDGCRWLGKGVPCGACQGRYIRTMSGRTFSELRTEDGLTAFRFEAHQRCFADHRTLVERFYVRGGDYRQNQGLIRAHANGRDWAEDQAEHLDRLKTRLERG